MIDIESDTFSDDEDVIQDEPRSSKDLALELDEELDKDCLTKRKRKRVYWGLEEVFKNYQDALKSVENKWTEKKIHSTQKGYKQYYKCSINPKCLAWMHLHILNDRQEVNLYRDQEEHKHEIILKDKRLRKEIKEKIIELFELRVTQPLSIIYGLRKQGFTNVPAPRQVSNFLARIKKKLKGQATISYSEFIEFCKQNDTVPTTDINKPFVVSYDVQSVNKSNQYIRMVVSSRYLLELATINGSFGCIDATYQLVYQGYPVIVAGHVDKNRSFHPICLALSTNENNKDYSFVMSSINVKKKHFN